MKKRSFLTACAVLTCNCMTGCITKKLFGSQHYSETVSQYLVSEDGKNLVVLGEHYHYVFDLPDSLRAVLGASYRKSVRATFSQFSAKGAAISGKYRLSLDLPSSPEDLEAARRAGFRDTGSRTMGISGEINGRRYRPSELGGAGAAQSFNKAYTIGIVDQPDAVGMGARLLLSPVTIAADGALAIGAVALAPIGVLFLWSAL